MTQPNRPPEPKGEDWQTWGRRLMAYLSQTRIAQAQKTGDETAADDGNFMWDRSGLYPVVSQSGAFNEVVVKQAAPSSSVGASKPKALAVLAVFKKLEFCIGEKAATDGP